MKRLILLLAVLSLTSCQSVWLGNDYENWKKCIEASDGSDAECYECDEKYNYGINVDLPEEISQATESDTLIATKRGHTLYVEFNN